MSVWIKEGFSFHDVQRIMFKLIENIDVFAGLTQNDVVLLLGLAEKCTFDPGATIVREGSTGAYLYVIIEGQVSVIKGGAQGGTELAKLGAGESFGEVSLIDHGVRSASVLATTPCIMLRLGEKACSKHPTVGSKIYRNLARILAGRLRDMDEAFILKRR